MHLPKKVNSPRTFRQFSKRTQSKLKPSLELRRNYLIEQLISGTLAPKSCGEVFKKRFKGQPFKSKGKYLLPGAWGWTQW